MFSNRVRFVVKCWLVLSVVVFFVRLGPVMARYRAAEQKFADLNFEAKQPAAPVIVNDPHSPRPELTLSMAGRAIKKLDDGNMPWADVVLPYRNAMYLAANQKGYFADLKQNRVMFEFSQSRDEAGGLYGIAVAGLYPIIATVGEHTVVQFWNATNGELLATVEDEHPTIAAVPDLSEHAKRHPNKLRYQDTGARRIAASPNGCLFAIGKVDGTVELWGDLAYREHPELLNDPHQADTRSLVTTKRLGFISRKKVHDGKVEALAFSHGGKKLVSVSGYTATGHGTIPAPDGNSAGYEMLQFDPNSKSDLVVSATSTLEEEWRQPLPSRPGQLALSIAAQHAVPGLLRAPFAVAMFHDGVLLGDLEKKEVTGTIKFPKNEPSAMVQSLAFHRTESALLTLHTSYTGEKNNVTIDTVMSLWQTNTRRRIATARFPGQFMAAGWDIEGTRLAMIRLNPANRNLPPSRSSFWPWESQTTMPFLFHVWDVNVVPQSE
jgi:hypothetical protein